MKICPVCKTECGDGALYCSNCGCALPPASVNPYTPPYESPVQQEAKDAVPPAPEPPQEAQPFSSRIPIMLRRGIRRKHIVMKGRGIFQHPRMDGMGIKHRAIRMRSREITANRMHIPIPTCRREVINNRFIPTSLKRA